MINNKKGKVRSNFLVFISSFVKALVITVLIGGIAYVSYILIIKSQGKQVNIESNFKDIVNIGGIKEATDKSSDAMKAFEKATGSLEKILGGK